MPDPFDKLNSQILKCATEVLNSQGMRRLGDQTAKIVQRRTRLGFGVERNNGRRSRLKPLASSYREQRRNEAFYFKKKKNSGEVVTVRAKILGGGKRHPDLSSTTTPGKSNLTFTGQLINSIKTTVARPFSFIVAPTGRRTDGKTNQEVAQFVKDQGRVFDNLSRNEIRQLQETVRRKMLDCLNKKL